jgi:hypothetical protein
MSMKDKMSLDKLKDNIDKEQAKDNS